MVFLIHTELRCTVNHTSDLQLNKLRTLRTVECAVCGMQSGTSSLLEHSTTTSKNETSSVLRQSRYRMMCVALLVFFRLPVVVTARPKAWVCCNLLAEIASSNPDIYLQLCDDPIALREESCRVWCVYFSVTSKPLRSGGLGLPGTLNYENLSY